MKFGIVVFPGSNCERDLRDAVTQYLGEQAEYLWYAEADLKGVDVVMLPGGFSYGDYLRSGAIARFAPIMGEVKRFADRGGPVLGICNGFQVLTEAGLLPGALMRNRDISFICRMTALRVENSRTAFSNAYAAGQVIHVPVAHADGNYIADEDTVKRLEDNGQIVFRYAEEMDIDCDSLVNIAFDNGSINRIAGVCNEGGNVVGMMPHPERNLWNMSELWTGEGRGVFDSVMSCCSQAVVAHG